MVSCPHNVDDPAADAYSSALALASPSGSQAGHHSSHSELPFNTHAQRQNVQVYCRFRPPRPEIGEDPAEIEQRGYAVQTDVTSNMVTMRRDALDVAGAGGPREGDKFTFDCVFPVETSQEQVFHMTAAPLVDEVFKGYNCTIFACEHWISVACKLHSM